MTIEWSRRALLDVNRLQRFLQTKDPAAASKVRRALFGAPQRLIDNPRIGAPLSGFAPRDIRRLTVGQYELRYEVRGDQIEVVRVWHMREDRPFSPES